MSSGSNQFIRYYNKFKDKIFVYFLYRTGFNRAVAEDLTSEVFLKAFKNFDTFDQTRSFQAWIYAIAHNHLVNYYRTAQRESSALEETYAIPSDAHKIELEYELEAIMKVIQTMEPSDQEVLLLRFVDGLSNAEIATLLNKEEGAIRTKISRSLAKLRKKIEK